MTTLAPIGSVPSPVPEASGSFANQASKAPAGSSDNSKDPGLPLTRPRIVIPSQALSLAREGMYRDESLEGKNKPAIPVITPKAPPSSPPTRTVETGKEKVGRWSEEEHKVFLEGLGKHGKQWKLIAGMIGTRTVVQVRTHAQKYFQRVERHNQKANPTSSGQGGGAKRKMSLPASLPSRTKKVKSGAKKASIPRSASITLVPAARTKSPPPEMMSTHPSYVSNDSASSSDSSWSYTVSPGSVNDMYEQLETLQVLTQDIQQQDTLQSEEAPVEQNNSASAEVQMYDFNGLGQDPLEWLIDAEPSILPESSLPVFPDLSSSTVSEDGHTDGTAPLESNDTTTAQDSTGVQASVPSVDDATPAIALEPSIVNELSTIADPTLTVQSLFLLPSNDC